MDDAALESSSSRAQVERLTSSSLSLSLMSTALCGSVQVEGERLDEEGDNTAKVSSLRKGKSTDDARASGW